MNDGFTEPVREIGRSTSFISGRRRLRRASTVTLRTGYPDMEMIIVTVHWPHFCEPAAITLGFSAQRLFDRSVHEYTLHTGLLSGRADYQEMARRPDRGIDVEPVAPNHVGC